MNTLYHYDKLSWPEKYRPMSILTVPVLIP